MTCMNSIQTYRNIQKQCQNPVDPYIELDNLLVFIDFVLLKLRAHRHVLFNIDQIKSSVFAINSSYFRDKNSSIQHIIKLSCALILANAYIKWFHLKNAQFQSILDHDHHIFYALEYGFYSKLFESFLGRKRKVH